VQRNPVAERREGGGGGGTDPPRAAGHEHCPGHRVLRSPLPFPADPNGAHGPARLGSLIVDGLIHLRAAGVSLVVDARGPRLPRILHWGQDLGALGASELGELALAAVPPVASNTMDAAVAVGVLPEHATGWAGLPGLRGHRDGRAWSPLFEAHGVVAAQGGNDVVAEAADAAAGLALRLEIELTPSGLVRMRAAVRNTGETPYTLDGLVLCLPVPAVADELLDFTGRHLRERSPQRRPFDVGTRLRDGRRGRTGTTQRCS
jgi:alpha-galactosidase